MVFPGPDCTNPEGSRSQIPRIEVSVVACDSGYLCYFMAYASQSSPLRGPVLYMDTYCYSCTEVLLLVIPLIILPCSSHTHMKEQSPSPPKPSPLPATHLPLRRGQLSSLQGSGEAGHQFRQSYFKLLCSSHCGSGSSPTLFSVQVSSVLAMKPEGSCHR